MLNYICSFLFDTEKFRTSTLCFCLDPEKYGTGKIDRGQVQVVKQNSKIYYSKLKNFPIDAKETILGWSLLRGV